MTFTQSFVSLKHPSKDDVDPPFYTKLPTIKPPQRHLLVGREILRAASARLFQGDTRPASPQSFLT